MALEIELATYKRILHQLRGDEGKFALIRRDELAGVFGTYEDALTEGYRRFGLEPFLVKKIETCEQVQFVSRLFEHSCRT